MSTNVTRVSDPALMVAHVKIFMVATGATVQKVSEVSIIEFLKIK